MDVPKILKMTSLLLSHQPLLILNTVALVQHFGCLLQDIHGPQMSNGKYALKTTWFCNKYFHSVSTVVMAFSSACLAAF